ncbi:MAG TPA: AAA family ATPase, partial [Mycobacteriales bacterium]|nr:AAA family ATPase [Mycobacteriales bacterium]
PLLSQLVERGAPGAAAYADALADVASAACSLGEPTLRAIAVATLSAAAQRRAVAASSDELVDQGPGAADRLVTAYRDPRSEPESAPKGTAVTSTAPATATGAEPALPTLEELLAELDSLIGLVGIKAEVHRQAQLLRVASLRTGKGLRVADMSRHLVFVGNPGTGKTLVARLVAGIYRALGLLSTGRLVECDRQALVAGYLGQTAMKTGELVATAIGGVLFIDEAYSLAGDDYGSEAIETLLKAMEDHRDDLVVIVAGYPAEMAEFISANPGLESRFHETLTFDDYTDDELVAIFVRNAARDDYSPTDECLAALRMLLAATPRGRGFGNGRFVRNVFEDAITSQASRLATIADPTVEQLRELVASDLPAATPLVPPEGADAMVPPEPPGAMVGP